MNYTEICTAVTLLVSKLQDHELQPDELLYFRPHKDGSAVAIAPDGRKYTFTQAEIEEMGIESNPRDSDRAIKVAMIGHLMTRSVAKKPARRTPYVVPAKKKAKK